MVATHTHRGFPSGWAVKNLLAMQETQETRLKSLGQEDSLEEGLATHSSILAWRIPWTEDPSVLQPTGLQRFGHDCSNWASTHVYRYNEGLEVRLEFRQNFWPFQSQQSKENQVHQIPYCLVAQMCLTLRDAMDCSPPASSVHVDSQARILEWVAMLSSRGSSQPRGQTQVSRIAGGFFTVGATREAHKPQGENTKPRPIPHLGDTMFTHMSHHCSDTQMWEPVGKFVGLIKIYVFDTFLAF